MKTKEETSLTRAADPVLVFIGDTLVTPMGSVVLSGLETGRDEVIPGMYSPKYNSGPLENPTTSEESTVAPVAGGMDWFEAAGLTLVADGKISETRFRRAMDAVRKGVARE